jgi:hypothetical protein
MRPSVMRLALCPRRRRSVMPETGLFYLPWAGAWDDRKICFYSAPPSAESQLWVSATAPPQPRSSHTSRPKASGRMRHPRLPERSRLYGTSTNRAYSNPLTAILHNGHAVGRTHKELRAGHAPTPVIRDWRLQISDSHPSIVRAGHSRFEIADFKLASAAPYFLRCRSKKSEAA